MIVVVVPTGYFDDPVWPVVFIVVGSPELSVNLGVTHVTYTSSLLCVYFLMSCGQVLPSLGGSSSAKINKINSFTRSFLDTRGNRNLWCLAKQN